MIFFVLTLNSFCNNIQKKYPKTDIEKNHTESPKTVMLIKKSLK